jgi:hypothetical protein
MVEDAEDYSHLRWRVPPLRAGSPEAAALWHRLGAGRRLVAQWRALVEEQAFDCFFLADGMWERLVPAAWRPFLEVATDAQLAGLPVGCAPVGWPVALRHFVRDAQAAQLEPFPTAAKVKFTGLTQNSQVDPAV